MPELAGGHEIEVVRGRLTDDRAEQILRFWAANGALEGEAARRRLPEVVCVLLGDGGEIAGVNSVYPDEVPLIGGRRFWIYRSFLLPAASGAAPAMIAGAFSALEDEFDPARADPIGLCLLIADTAQKRAQPAAEWQDPTLLHAGHLADGRAVRIGYFAGAKIGPGSGPLPSPARKLDDGYRIDLFEAQETIDAQAVIDLWSREGVVPQQEAQRRAEEILLVASTEVGELVGVSTAYRQRNKQLRMDLWYYRAFVSTAHRKSNVAVSLAMTGRDHLQERFVTGTDAVAGIAYEVENEGLKRYFNDALWLPTGFAFIGENERGDHVRVRYFPGAQAPDPPG